MADKITDEMIEYIGILAKLELSDAEREQARGDMERMLQQIDLLKELDTEGMEPMTHRTSAGNVFREDVVENKDGRQDTLANAPKQREGAFQVPKTV